jgi:cysteine desulfurase
MDHAATTPVDPEVREAMLPYLSEEYGNPNSLYELGRRARRAVEAAREEVASYLNAHPDEIIFTGGGSEADNLAIKGAAALLRARGNHIITSAIEHHAVLHTCQSLERDGFRVTYLPVDSHGLVDPEALRAAITADTILVTIMHANNEVGTVEPIEELGAICRERGVLFHTDAVQSFGKLALDVEEMPLDMVAISAHKFYGPKGVGALWVRRGVRLRALIDGGGQEKGLRSGTENVAGIVGLGKAVELLKRHGQAEAERLRALAKQLHDAITSRIPHVIPTGHPTQRVPGLVSFCIRYIEGEAILLALDELGICASSGSACTSGSLEPSHVLTAMGFPHEVAHGSLRLSLGRSNTPEQVETVAESLARVVERLRVMSPLWADAQRRGEV